MWGFESLLPCQLYSGGGWRAERVEIEGAKAVGEMAQAAKLSKEETGGEGASFSIPAPISKLGEHPRRLRQFLHDVRVEIKQVNWPSRDDVVSTTIVVTVTVAFFGIYFFMTDSVLGKAISWLIDYAKKH